MRPKRLLAIGENVSRLIDKGNFSVEFQAQWDLCAVGNAAQAFDLLESFPFDAIIAEDRLADQSGHTFLDQVMSRWPDVERFLAADMTDHQAMLKCVGSAHYFLTKPCQGISMEQALARAAQVSAWMRNPRAKRLVTQMRKVPSPPAIYYHLLRELRSLGVSLESVTEIITQDGSLSTKVLEMANSAAFGLQKPVDGAEEVVVSLGIETTKSLVLLAHVFAHFDGLPAQLLAVESLWRHALAVGRMARAVARMEKSPSQTIDQSFTAGLLHDMGRLVLAANDPDRFACLPADGNISGRRLEECECEVFGATHAEVGGWLAAIWGLPLEIVEAVMLHHHPSRHSSEGFCVLTAVHVADALDQEFTLGCREETPGLLDGSYLASLHLQDRVAWWREYRASMRTEFLSKEIASPLLAA